MAGSTDLESAPPPEEEEEEVVPEMSLYFAMVVGILSCADPRDSRMDDAKRGSYIASLMVELLIQIPQNLSLLYDPFETLYEYLKGPAIFFDNYSVVVFVNFSLLQGKAVWLSGAILIVAATLRPLFLPLPALELISLDRPAPRDACGAGVRVPAW
ncbi:hypothetical protein B0H10DRAFT_1967379 [Mycena sp. CBHHK59/15]|nr:hypothetical protein B0H10DRAFT_1967379 [Mycena sp. CBHHK59/15]